MLSVHIGYYRYIRGRKCHHKTQVPSQCLSHFEPNQTVNDGVAHSKNPRKCAYHVTLTLSTPGMHAYPETIVCKFGCDPAICLGEEAICAKLYRQTDGQTTDATPLYKLILGMN